MSAAPGAHVIKNAVVTVDGVEYANQVSKARLVPDQPVQTMRTLVPDGVVQDVDSPVWTFELSGLQINVAGGLAKALRDANGGEVDVVLQPRAGSGQATATFTVLALMPEFGGNQGEWATQELSLPVQGQPVFGTSA
ncbi:phage tail protein [Micromonospora chalcea]|uniref:phage tail protein n=1 Tax=Micromonospora chalcea TaxID=1874 RepID=UPI0021A7F166|nr:phage tail protein [Micromonospora chalcea]MCT2277993.1 phage tail protein [Micromonospora chalcea]